MKKVYSILLGALLLSIAAHAQVGVGTTVPQGALDVTSATNGILVPRVSLTSKNVSAPVVNPNGGGTPINGTLVWNTATAGVSPNNVVPGFYYWSGSAWAAIAGATGWAVTGNSGTAGGNTAAAGTNFIGTTDAQNLDFRTNNNYVGRFSSLGEFFVGTLNTVITGDLMNAVGNATFPWAINGYTTQNGSGVYGSVQSGNTIFAGVQGEYLGTNAQGTGVRGINLGNTAGTSFNAAGSGVSGAVDNSNGSYKFGVHGRGGLFSRSGGVMGYDFGIAGALGYYSSGGADYSVYGFGTAYTTGAAAGKQSQQFPANSHIGLGIYGGVMGGWVRGLKYGFHAKGETYSLYVDGNSYMNRPLAYLIANPAGGKKIAAYATASPKPEMSANGKTNLVSGKAFVRFDSSFSAVVSNTDDIVITATPQGKSNGVYIDGITKDGFWIRENNEGTSDAKISWIAITKIAGQEDASVPAELLADDFDAKMDGVMFNDFNASGTAQSLWWDGAKMRWDKPQNDKPAADVPAFSRQKPKRN